MAEARMPQFSSLLFLWYPEGYHICFWMMASLEKQKQWDRWTRQLFSLHIFKSRVSTPLQNASQGNRVAEVFSRSLGFASSTLADCWALRDGLSLAVQFNINFSIVKVDSLIAANQTTSSILNVYSPHLLDCKQLMGRLGQVTPRHNHFWGWKIQCVNVLGVYSGLIDATFAAYFIWTPPLHSNIHKEDTITKRRKFFTSGNFVAIYATPSELSNSFWTAR